MTDLTEFLLARIAEDEAAARAASEGPWEPDSDGCCIYLPEVGILAQVAIGGGDGTEADVAHIARHDPARVLAQCAAYRAIVGMDGGDVDHDEDCPGDPCECGADEANAYGWAPLRALASIWAGHESYDERWTL